VYCSTLNECYGRQIAVNGPRIDDSRGRPLTRLFGDRASGAILRNLALGWLEMVWTDQRCQAPMYSVQLRSTAHLL